MKRRVIFCLILLTIVGISSVSASEYFSETDGIHDTGVGNPSWDSMIFNDIGEFSDMWRIIFVVNDTGSESGWINQFAHYTGNAEYGFELKYGTTVVGNGTCTIGEFGYPLNDYFQYDFDYWNIGALDGNKILTFSYTEGSYDYGKTPSPLGNVACVKYANTYPPADHNYPAICKVSSTNRYVPNAGTTWYSVEPTPTPTPTPDPSNATISVNILEKYSNAALVGQAITVTPTTGGSGEIKTSTYGETLHFNVVNGLTYWFNATRSGYQDYNETYTITSASGIYNVYMERILTPIANHSYAHFSVVDQTNGGLIPNAEIRLSDGQTKLTNSAGYTWFSVNNSEQINYYVSKPSGYWPAYGAMNLTADESILVALQRYTGPTATATMPGWTPVTVPTTGTGVDPVVTLSAQLRQQNVQEGMDVWYTNLPFISQFLFLLFIIGGLGLMAGGTRRN
jgi:hypothetical protein